jgi:N-acetylmuramoyl-L-alanine amidase
LSRPGAFAQYSSVAKLTTLLACALVLLAGCSTVPGPPGRALPPNWDTELGAASEPEPAQSIPLPTHLPVAEATAPASTKSTPAPAPVAPAAPDWISLNAWAAQNGLRALQKIPLFPQVAYAITTLNGVFAVRVGSQTAFWDRLDVRLGFAPQQIGDQIYLHPLDVEKTLEPLSRGLTVATSPSRVVVIDPGHGGVNPGTRSVVDGRNEKEFTLDWAKRLAPLLAQQGWQVFLTRTNDVDVSLPDRVGVAEKYRADLFLSLHFNSAGEGREQAGLESYCLTPAGLPSSLTRGYDDDLRQVFPNNAHDADNLRYAVRVQRSLLQVNGNNDRGVRRARFLGVLRGQQRPAVLIEGGYLSNPQEARRIADPQYRQKMAEAVAKALE